MSQTNHAISEIFTDLASIYRYLGTEERFRALAYSKAARVIDGLKEDVRELIEKGVLEDVPGIGESIAEKISEYVRTGKIKKYEALKKKVPHELMELMNVSGFGPQSLKQIHTKLHISTKAQLIKGLEDGHISKLKGFGAKKVENMLRGLKLYKQTSDRILLWEAMELSDSIVEQLRTVSQIGRIEVAGSVRRRRETIGDIDILITCARGERKKILEAFVALKGKKTILAKGDTRASILMKTHSRQVDLRIMNPQEWGAGLLYFTGSKEHNVHLRTVARGKGLKINEYGVFRIKSGKRVAGETEEEIYKLLGFQYIPPELREMNGEFETAAKHRIPKLIELKDIKGDMQMHSTWSDGSMDIGELAAFVLRNYDYEYIVLTDHSEAARIAGGMNERELRKQMKQIDAVNKKLGKKFIKKGVEVDILPDGKLDLDDALLSEMDWVCASIHSSFRRDNTQRLISACENPYVHCIGHPSGRLIGKRDSYPVDWSALFTVAAKTGTALEINAEPDRMDLNDTLARQAHEAGVMLTISTDSHAENNYAYMKLGVSIARRAWCTTKDILNTQSWADVAKFAAAKRKHRA